MLHAPVIAYRHQHAAWPGLQVGRFHLALVLQVELFQSLLLFLCLPPVQALGKRECEKQHQGKRDIAGYVTERLRP